MFSSDLQRYIRYGSNKMEMFWLEPEKGHHNAISWKTAASSAWLWSQRTQTMCVRGGRLQLPTESTAPVNHIRLKMRCSLSRGHGHRPQLSRRRVCGPTARLMQTIPFSLQRTENQSGRSRVCVRAAVILHPLLLPPRREATKLEAHTHTVICRIKMSSLSQTCSDEVL